MSRDDLRAAADKEVDRWEQAIADELIRLFDRQEAVVLARLQGTKARKHTRHWNPPGDRALEVKGIIDPVRWLLDAAGSTRPVITRLFGAVYGRVAKQLAAADPEEAAPPGDRIEKAIERRLELISEGVKTAQEEVESLIKREEDLGTPMPEIVSQVQDLYHDRKPSWAARIATVSAVGSINQAALFAAADAGSSAKQWLSRRDPKVRDTHEKADGQVRLLDERFRLGGIPTHPKRSLLLFPGDPSPSVPLDEIMNCRCTLLFSPPRAKKALATVAAAAVLATGGGLEEKKVASGDSQTAAADRRELEQQAGEATGRYVRTDAGAARFGQSVGEEIIRDGGVEYRRGGTKAKPAPTTVAGYARMFDQVPVEQWGGGDVGISHELPDGRRVWLYGDTLSKNNGFVHSTAIVQTGGRLHVSEGGKQLLPNSGKDPADPKRQLISWIDGVRQGPSDNTLIVSSMQMSVGTASAWDFRNTREGQSREAVVRVKPSGDLEFVKWKGWAPTPTENNPHLADDNEILGPNHYAYGTVRHDITLADGSQLTTRSQNWDNDFEDHLTPAGELRYKDWRPMFGSAPAAESKALPKTQVCEYCKSQASKRIIHSEGMGYIPVCEGHVEKGKDAAARCTPDGSVDRSNIDSVREIKAAPRRVRTVGGAQQYGQSIGSVIRADVLGSIPGFGDVEVATRDRAVRRMITDQYPQVDQTGTRVAVLRDARGRVGAYAVWEKASGQVLAVSVHPKLRGKKVGDQLVAVVVADDPNVKPMALSRLAKVATAATVAGALQAPAPAAVTPPPAPQARGQVTDRSSGAVGGTTGDFDADAARIDKLQRAYLKDRVDTVSLHQRGGRWSRAREAQQQEIIDHFLTRPGVKKDHKLLVLGGLPGAGKTTTINSQAGQDALGLDLSEYVVVNADEVKSEMIARGMVPDYPGLTADEAATLYHTESFEVAHSLMRQAARQGLNFAYDTSLKSQGQLGFATTAAGRNAPPGYETTMLFVDVPIATAKQRAKDRYLAGGRYMPLGLIDGMSSRSGTRSSGPAENFDALKRSVDRWAVFDNAGGAPALTGQGGKKAPKAPAAAPAASAPAAPASSVASMIPALPAGATSYTNSSGKVVHVLPDGTVQAYKPDGTPTRTTATADKLAQAYGNWTHSDGPALTPASGPRSVPSQAAAPTPAQPVSSPNLSAAASTPTVPSNLPTPDPGTRVFAHPQGKHIYLSPDGSMQVYKPDGKRGTSSATPAKLLAGYGGWSELGLPDDSADLPATPTPAGAAPKLVAASSTPLDVDAGAPAPAGAMPVVPMDFNEMAIADVPKAIADPKFVGQQKVDGIRGVLTIEPGKAPWFASKKGDRLVSSTAAKTTTPMLAKLPATPAGSPSYRVEGEILNGKFYVFDMVVVGQERTPYEDRETMARAWVDAVSAALPQVEMLPTARTAAEKQALWDAVLNSGAEGMMFKDTTAGYQGGARVSHTLKAKITASADVVILERNRGGKDNAVFGMMVNGKVTEIGTVSTGGKDKALGQINVGDVVEVEYLWATPGAIALTQPRIIRKRKDKTPNDATSVDQLRFVDKSVLALAAKSARLQLEYAVEGSLS